MSKPRKAVPEFANEAEERLFWETHDTADYVDWSTARSVRLPNLNPSTTYPRPPLAHEAVNGNVV